MNKRNKVRIIMACLLCSGLLMIGIGLGVGVGELSQFTYAGSKLLKGSSIKTVAEDIRMFHPEGRIYINAHPFSNSVEQKEILITSEDMEPGTIHIEASYRSVVSVPKIDHYNNSGNMDMGGDETFFISDSGSPVALFFAYKDEILSDIKKCQLGDYRESEYTDLAITVNPKDKERIVFQ